MNERRLIFSGCRLPLKIFFLGWLSLLFALPVGGSEENQVLSSLHVMREAEVVHQGHRFALELEMPVRVHPEGRSFNASQMRELGKLLKDVEDYVATLQALSRQAEALSARWSSLMQSGSPLVEEQGGER